MLRQFIRMSGLLLFVVYHPVFADQVADLTESYTASGVPGEERPGPDGVRGIIGGGLFNYKKVVGEADRKTLPLPTLLMTYSDWAYWSIGGGGVWIGSREYGVKVGAGLTFHSGWKPNDDVVLAGMEERDRSLDGSINFLWRTRIVNLGLNYYHDLLDVSNGAFATAKLSHNFWPGIRFRLTPSVGVEWQSADMVDYYYGVRPSEETPSRPSYSGTDTTNFSLNISGAYLLSRSWSLLGGINARHLGDGIANSPIVLDRDTTVVYLGAGWRL